MSDLTLACIATVFSILCFGGSTLILAKLVMDAGKDTPKSPPQAKEAQS